ncbi:BQ2448_2572 [Microbotryum intermedium]|uniref:BQ2448_2572 protein n=1 Tax=Microbotryum intermedium TaxID=269621 RepID=A0A238F6S3_9BASI|nr:BQ2448_2572 [Microbotryum intermedium]
MFAGHPGTSPASFKGDVSFLQRAALRGDTTLQPPPSGDPSLPFVSAGSTTRRASANNGHIADDPTQTGDEHDDVYRGRNRQRRGSSGKTSRASIHSLGGTRLSPTRESSAGEEDDDDRSSGVIGVGSKKNQDGLEHVFVEDEPERSHSRTSTAASTSGTVAVDLTKPLSIAPAPHAPTTPTATEHTPFLGSTRGSTHVSVPLPEDGQKARAAFWHEIKVLVSYAVPIAGTHFLEYSLLVVTVVSVGHIGTVELAAASIASMTSNVVALSLIQGFCTALDTLCPQAYTSNPRMTSLYALRTFLILMILVIPQVIIFWNAEVLLLALRQDPKVAERASTYLRSLSFGLPGYAGFECIRRWLQAQGMMVAPVVTLIIAAPLNVLLNYLLVWGPESIRLGFIGAPISTAISMNVMFIVSVIYAVLRAPRDAWGGFSKEVFHDLGLNITLGLAGSAAVVSEWWSWEIVGLASSFLGPTALAAQSVLLTSASLFYQIPYALSVAAAVRAGNLLGAQRPDTARITSYATMTLAIGVAGINSVLLVIFRHRWGLLFSSEKEVIEVVASVLGLVAAFQLSDGISGAMAGLLRGAGKAPLGAVLNLISYYVVGLPLGMALTFAGPKMGLKGLWLGLTAALTGTATLTTWVVLRLDWRAESENARIRMGVAKRDEEDDGPDFEQ